jgi:hypothetical protein
MIVTYAIHSVCVSVWNQNVCISFNSSPSDVIGSFCADEFLYFALSLFFARGTVATYSCLPSPESAVSGPFPIA